MKVLVDLEDNSVLEYPFLLSSLTNPANRFGRIICLAETPAEGELEALGIFDVVATDKPVRSPAYDIEEDLPIFENNAWKQQWKQVAIEDEGLLYSRTVIARNQMWEKIKTERERRNLNGGFRVEIGEQVLWFNSDLYSRTQMQGLVDDARMVQMAGGNMNAPLVEEASGEMIVWKTLPGVWVPMTPNIVLAVRAAIKKTDFLTFKAGVIHQTLMNASSNPYAYNYMSGHWPDIFTGS